MPWQQIKSLKEKRAAIVFEARGLLETQRKENRDLTAEEAKRFDDIEKEAASLAGQIDRLERGKTLEDSLPQQQQIPRQNLPGPDGDFPSIVADDTSESRSLLPGEKCTDYVTKRGLVGQRPEVGLGAYLRSIAQGPRNEAERRALSEGTAGSGGYTVNPFLAAEFIDALRPASVLSRAGARTVPLSTNTTYVARLLTDPAAQWIAELEDVPESGLTMDRVTLTSKVVAVTVKVSRELLMDSVNAESMLVASLVRSFATEIDRVGLLGSGTGDEPTGISATAGINAVSMGTNGATLAATGGYDKLLDAIYEIQIDNAGEPTAAVMHPRTNLGFSKLADSTAQPLRKPDALASLPFLTTAAMSIAETEGTSEDCSSVIVGDFKRLLIGVHLAPRIEVVPSPIIDGKLQAQFVCWGRIAVAVEQPKAFAKLTGIRP